MYMVLIQAPTLPEQSGRPSQGNHAKRSVHFVEQIETKVCPHVSTIYSY